MKFKYRITMQSGSIFFCTPRTDIEDFHFIIEYSKALKIDDDVYINCKMIEFVEGKNFRWELKPVFAIDNDQFHHHISFHGDGDFY